MVALTPAQPATRSASLEMAEVDYRAGILSVNAVAQKHGVPESSLRREAKRRGWTRASSEVRRQEVALALDGERMANNLANQKVEEVLNEAMNQDVADMNRGLAVARKVLEKLLKVVDQVEDPRDFKVVIEANRAAVETIRKIRSLDQPPPPPVPSTISMTVTDGFDKLRAAFAKAIKEHGAG